MLALLTRLRNTIAHPMPASLRAQLLGYLRQFEEKARAAGVPQDEVMLSRYVLCTALDEAVMSTPWGSASEWGKQSLLITLHNEAWGGEKVFQLLDHCLQNPRQRLHILELLYLCISLGFEGRYRVMNDGRSQLDALRERWQPPSAPPMARSSASCRRTGAAWWSPVTACASSCRPGW